MRAQHAETILATETGPPVAGTDLDDGDAWPGPEGLLRSGEEEGGTPPPTDCDTIADCERERASRPEASAA